MLAACTRHRASTTCALDPSSCSGRRVLDWRIVCVHTPMCKKRLITRRSRRHDRRTGLALHPKDSREYIILRKERKKAVCQAFRPAGQDCVRLLRRFSRRLESRGCAWMSDGSFGPHKSESNQTAGQGELVTSQVRVLNTRGEDFI